MQKIASPQQLQAEIHRILAMTQGPERPSRERLAAELLTLAERVAADAVDLPKLGRALQHWYWDKKDPAYKLGMMLLAGKPPSSGLVRRVKAQLEKLYQGRPSSSFWGDLKGSRALEELHWIIEQLGKL